MFLIVKNLSKKKFKKFVKNSLLSFFHFLTFSLSIFSQKCNIKCKRLLYINCHFVHFLFIFHNVRLYISMSFFHIFTLYTTIFFFFILYSFPLFLYYNNIQNLKALPLSQPVFRLLPEPSSSILLHPHLPVQAIISLHESMKEEYKNHY